MKNIFTKIFFTIIAVISINSAFAQKTLTGKITDSKTSSPINNVAVFIPELNKGTTSNEKGEYTFDNLPQSIITIQFSITGYKSVLKTANTASAANLDAAMESSIEELEEVVITANKSKLVDNTPFSIDNISQKEIRKYASPSLMGNLSYQPGIDRITIGNGIGKPVIRGLSFNQTMLYAQGTRIENQQWDDHHDLGLTDIGIQNVELVRGPAALIYGADALGGALIFVDEKPAALGKSAADANLGFASNTLGLNADAGYKHTNNNGFFYGIRVGGSSHTSYLQGEKDGDPKNANGETDMFAPNSKFMNANAKLNVGVTKKWGTSKLTYSFLYQQIGIIEDERANASSSTTSDDEEQRDRGMEAPYQSVTTQIISSENTYFTGKSKLNLNLGYQMNDRKEFEPTPEKTAEMAIGLKQNTATYDLKWTSNEEKNFGVTIGTQGTFLKNTNGGLESLVPDAAISTVGGYGLLRYDYKKLNLLAGVRYDMRHIEAEGYEPNGKGVELDSFKLLHNKTYTAVTKPETDFEKDYHPFSFSLGAAYHFNKNFTAKLNAASGYTAPNYAQLATFGKHEGTYRFEQGKFDLEVEQNKEADLGLNYEGENFSGYINGYINKIQNYIYISNTGDSMTRKLEDGTKDTLPLYKYQQGNATIIGSEIGIDVHPKKIKWLDVKASYGIINGTLDAGGYLPYIPSNKLIGEVKLMKEKVWKLHDTYVSAIVSNFEQRKNVAQYEISSEAYTLIDLHVGGKFKFQKQEIAFNIFCTNLLNTAYYNQLSLVKYIGVRDMGRNIGIQLHVPIGVK